MRQSSVCALRLEHPIRNRLIQLLLSLTLVLAVLTPPSSAGASREQQYYVEPTGHTLADPFLTYWADHDGLQTFGLPISEPQPYNGGRAQFFQYGVLATKPVPGSRLVEPLDTGRALLEARHEPEREVAGRRAGSSPEAEAFLPFSQPHVTARVASQSFDRESNHTIGELFRTFYVENGGEQRFGQPLSEPYRSGGITLQWLERGRLQAWTGDPRTVWLAPIGQELAHALDIDTFGVPQGQLPVLDPSLFRSFQGDGTIPEAHGNFTPARIMIPEIGVNATIEQVGITNGVMGVPHNPWNVGWYPSLSRPGDDTNVVMAGHRDWWSIGPTVFYRLGQLGTGDRIYLIGPDGAGFTYEVTMTWTMGAYDSPHELVRDTGIESITLVTCVGYFNGIEYDTRLIVRAERI